MKSLFFCKLGLGAGPQGELSWTGRLSGIWQVRKHAVMAVYTDVSDAELAVFIAKYDLGEVLSCRGIAEGVENSNYLITTARQQCLKENSNDFYFLKQF